MTAPARTLFKKKLQCFLKLQSGENERKNHCSLLNFFQSWEARKNWSRNTLPLLWVEKASLLTRVSSHSTTAAIPNFGSLQPESQATPATGDVVGGVMISCLHFVTVHCLASFYALLGK